MDGPASIARRVEHRVALAAAARGWFRPWHVTSGPGAGLRLSLRSASADYLAGTNELPVQHAVAAALAPGGVFYDVGSNVGFFSILAARVVGTRGHVYAVEPVPDNAQCIQANASANGFGNVTVLPVAAGARSGTATLLLSRHPGGATLSPADEPADLSGRLDVETVVIDELVAEGRMRPPTVVKVDVEGVEFDVLRGLSDTLDSARPVVVCELDSTTETGVAEKVAHVRQLLESHGYDLRELPRSYSETPWHVVHVVAEPRPHEA